MSLRDNPGSTGKSISRTLKVRGGIILRRTDISVVLLLLSENIFPPQIIQVLLIYV